MKEFLKKLVSLITTIGIVLFACPTANFGHGYLTAYTTKLTPEPIQFIGASHLSFGLSTATLEQTLNEPFNSYGFHGAVGLKYHLNEIQ